MACSLSPRSATTVNTAWSHQLHSYKIMSCCFKIYDFVPIYLPATQNEYMKEDFEIKIETWHKPDMGTVENVSLRKSTPGPPILPSFQYCTLTRRCALPHVSGAWPGRADVEKRGGGSHRHCQQRGSGGRGEFSTASYKLWNANVIHPLFYFFYFLVCNTILNFPFVILLKSTQHCCIYRAP